MADVEFEPLHGEIEDEEEDEFILGGRKKDTPGKKYKQKGGQLFPRKSVEKKEKNIVIDNTKAFPTSPISTKSAFNHHHHHQPRNVEGFVGPGDIQFGSSPPNYDGESMEQNSLSQSTGSIPISVSQNKPTNRTLQLPVRPQQPPTWTQVSHPIPIAQQQRTLSQEKLTLLEQANFGAGNKQMTTSLEGFRSPEKIDERRGFHPPSFQPQTTPPRVASPTENRTNIPQVPIIATPGKRFERSESWGPTSQGDHTPREENWADFSKSFDGALSADEEEFEYRRRRASQVSTISEGSEGSYVSEIDEGVWKITEEQRQYYLTQFKKLQPNEKGLIKGPQARDFFMKSNLPVEVLSKIWHLSDINKDNALDIEEFCIAMHLVVAVKHEVELPAVLPAMLAPKQTAQGFTASFAATHSDIPPKPSARFNGHPEEEQPHSPQHSNQPKDDQHWANFDVDRNSPTQEIRGEEQILRTARQAAGTDEISHPSHGRVPFDSAEDIKGKPLNTADNEHSADEKSSGNLLIENSKNVAGTPNTRESKQQSQQASEANMQSPVVKEPVSKKTSIGIARPRGLGPTINLMDSAPGQLLPPPDSRKNRKMAQQAQPEPAGHISPPVSPDTRFSTDFSSEFRTSANDEKEKSVSKKSVEEIVVKAKSFDSDVKRKDSDQRIDSVDGFEPPKLAPRSNQKMAEQKIIDEPKEPQNNGHIEVAEMFLRRSSSVRRGERPRSYTADSRSSMESLVDALPRSDSKDFAVPPTPPPRKTKGHKRGSSLDLNKIFGAKAQHSMAEIKEKIGEEVKTKDLSSLPPRIPRADAKDEKRDKKERGDIHGIARPRPAPKHHRRSTSHDPATPLAPLAPPPKTGEGLIKDGPPSGHRKKPAPPRPHSAIRNTRSKSLERTIELTRNEEPLVEDKKPRQLRRPLRQKRQRHEIQAEIRLLREKNASIASLNSELHHELREAMESRTQLERRFTKTKQSFE